MKLNVVTSVRFSIKFNKGEYIKLQDELDLHNGIYIIEGHDDFSLVMRNTKTNKQLLINSTDDVSRYDFQTGTMRMEFIPSDSNKCFEKKEEPTKKECERATDEFAKNFRRKLEQMYGMDIW